MGRRFALVVGALALWLGSPGARVTPVAAQSELPAPAAVSETPAAHHDVSPPLSHLPPAATDHHGHVMHPWRQVPHGGGNPVHVDMTGSGPASAPAPTLLTSFEGVGQGFTGPAGTFRVSAAPPDPNGTVGPNHYVEIVNTDFAVFNKSGTPLFGPVPISTLWNGFGGLCQSRNDGDPDVSYDALADRWLISQFALASPNFSECVAVSQTGDPTGAYYRYEFTYSTFPDYPKVSVWPDAYYVTYNMFDASGNVFLGGEACALDRARMLQGQGATQQCTSPNPNFGGYLASTLDGTSQPPAGSPNYVVALGSTDSNGNGNTLATWKFRVNWTTPSNTTFSGPAALSVPAFQLACNAGTCIPQSGTAQKLDSLGDRLMYRLAYRNFGDHEALVANHSVNVGSSVGVRWYELRPVNGSLSLFQQGTYAPDATFRWMGSVAQDQAGNIGLGFSAASGSMFPSIHYTGRLATDPAGSMTQGEGTLIAGGGSQNGQNLSRWGDYTSMAVDPRDNCTFWYTNQYQASTGAFNWHTRVGTFALPGCGNTQVNDFSIAVNPSSLSLVQGTSGTSTVNTTTTSGSAQTLALSVSGAPSGATASLSPTSITSGGSSTLTVNSGTASPGTYTLTITATGASATHTTSLTLTISSSGGGGGITNGTFETGDLSGWASGGVSASVTTATPHSGSFAALVGTTSPANGDSGIWQTFTAPSGSSTLVFWYRNVCQGPSTSNWATAQLNDNTAGTSSTPLPRTCTSVGTWTQVSASIVAGHSYTITLINHVTNSATSTEFDDVAIAAPPPNDFSIAVSPNTLNLVQGSSGTSTVSTTTTSGSAQTVALSVGGAPSGATASLSPTSITSGGSSTLTVNTGTASPGTYTLTITGTGASATHSTSLTLTITSSGGGGITNGTFETGDLSGWTSGGVSASVTTATPHSGSFAALVGTTSTANGDSGIFQTFTAPSGSSTLVFWYRNVCPGPVTSNWATAILNDNTAGTTSTPLPRTCTSVGAWTQVSASIVAGHSYTMMLINHPSNTATSTEYDDVSVR